MGNLGKGLAVGLTAIAAAVVACVIRTEESLVVMVAPCAVSFFIYVMGNE